MSYGIRLTPEAEADIERLYTVIVQRRGEDAARLWYEAYTRAVERLRSMPLSCGLAYENPRFAEDLRHLLFELPKGRRYRALFVVRGNEVAILAVRAPGEKPISSEDIEP